MSALNIPNQFTASTTILSADMNANFEAISDWAAGNIDQTNFDTMTGAISWSVSSNVLSISSANAGTEGSAKFTHTGVLAASKAALWVTSSANQANGHALAFIESTNASSSIPGLKVSHAGTGSVLNLVQSGVLAANKAALHVTDSAAQTTGKSTAFVEQTSASATIPVLKLEGAGSGPLIRAGTSAADKFEVNSDGSITKCAEPPSGNLFYNSAFRYWQRTTSTTATYTNLAYGPDRWYIYNYIGTDGIVTISRIAGLEPRSTYACKVHVSTAPSASQADRMELYQTLPNEDSLRLYNKTASFGIYVRAFGNVNQVGIQFWRKETENKIASTDSGTSNIGSEITATVNTSTNTLIKIEGQALGTGMTTAGVIGVRIRATGASSGNTYDLNNGFAVELAMLNEGSRLGNYEGMFKSQQQEIQALERFYEKSYDIDTVPTTSNSNGVLGYVASINSAEATYLWSYVQFKAKKRSATPTVAVYATSGTQNRITDITDTANFNAAATNVCSNGFLARTDATHTLVNGNLFGFHWTADADL